MISKDGSKLSVMLEQFLEPLSHLSVYRVALTGVLVKSGLLKTVCVETEVIEDASLSQGLQVQYLISNGNANARRRF